MVLSIIIVNFNSGDILEKCVTSLYAYEKNVEFEIIIVDQNSKDNSKEIIEDLSFKYSNIKFIFNVEIKSFSYANNQGFDISSGKYILIMNPDIIFREELFNKLIKRFDEYNQIGAICPLLKGENGVFQNNYFQRYPSFLQFIFFHSFISKMFSWSMFLMNRYLENQDIVTFSEELQYIEQIPCAFFLTKRIVFEEVGKMDDNYFLFFEDVDLSFQINKKYKLAIDKSLSVIHLGGSTMQTDNNFWLYGRFISSEVYFFKKNYSRISTFFLRITTVMNSYFVLFFEYLKILLGKKNEYRIKKHNYFIKEVKKI